MNNILTENPNLKIYTIIITPLVIFLIYLLYKYSFSTRTKNVLDTLSYSSKLQLKNLPFCIDIDPKYRYKLCDYYISSSYMTPCIGNQHYDYVSLEMIQKVLQSGARYIQIPICSDTPDYQANPVVATAVYGTQVITSLNTLNIIDVLKVIKSYAFYTDTTINKDSNINYPLIIHFILNTTNTYVLNLLSSSIKNILLDVIIPNTKYKEFPIGLEQVCNLLNKIILIATPEYKNSNLTDIIIPNDNLFQIINYNDINNFNIAQFSTQSNTITNPITTNYNQYQQMYNNLLSESAQMNNTRIFNKKYPSLQYIIDNSNSIGSTILQDNDILNNILSFNKVGMTIITPMNPSDVLTTNYDPSNAFMNGCQLVTMNFQNNDNNMSSYIDIFKNSSFRLKPDSLRFSETEQPIQNLRNVYTTVQPIDHQINTNFISRYINSFISIESYSLPNTYITVSQNFLSFRPPNQFTIPQITDSNSMSRTLDISQCFRVNKSSLSGNDICINLESALYPNQYITINNNNVILQPLSSTTSILRLQSFYPCLPKTNDTETTKFLVSFRSLDDDNPLWLFFRSKSLVALYSNNDNDSNNNMTFMINTIHFNYIIKIYTINGGSIISTNGIVGILANNINSATTYIIKPVDILTKFEDIRQNIQVYIQNHTTKTYLYYSNNVLKDDSTTPNNNSIFIIKPSNNFYTITNTNGKILTISNNINLQFLNQSDNVFNSLFKIELSYEKL